MGKSKRSVNDVEERRSPDVPDEAAMHHRAACPLCKRAHHREEEDTYTERALMASSNPYVVYSRLHGSSPDQLSERLIRMLDVHFSVEITDIAAIPGITGVLLTHGSLYRVQADLLCDCWLDGKSHRAMAEELGITHPTVQVMLDYARLTLTNMLHTAGFRSTQLQEAT